METQAQRFIRKVLARSSGLTWFKEESKARIGGPRLTFHLRKHSRPDTFHFHTLIAFVITPAAVFKVTITRIHVADEDSFIFDALTMRWNFQIRVQHLYGIDAFGQELEWRLDKDDELFGVLTMGFEKAILSAHDAKAERSLLPTVALERLAAAL